MSSYGEQYQEAVTRFLALQAELEQRKAQLRAQAEEAWNNPALPKPRGTSLNLLVNGRLASDPVYKDIRTNMDRAVAEANMWGLGAIIRNLVELGKGLERR